MTREECFKENFPQFVTEKGECLSPYFDLFNAGIELATYELYKGCIQTLTKENTELKAKIEKMKCCSNCDFLFRDGNCYYDKECKNKDHWKLRR